MTILKSSRQLLLVFILLPFLVKGQNCELKGSLINQKGKGIPYASIYLPALGKSGMANEKGEFTIKGTCDVLLVKFQSLGYQSKSIKIDFSKEQEQRIKLKQVAYQLREVNISPNKEDPAYNIIRKATVMAAYYKKQINAYQAKLYIRSYFDVNDMPWMIEKIAPEDELEIMKSGDVKETIVAYSFKKPNIITEKILARRSARPDSNLMGSNYINLNFYNLGGSSIINPLSRGAFHLYNFEYQHSFYQDKQKVHKIKIIPKRKGNDLMKGDIYINDGIWNINQVDVSFRQQMAELKYNQVYQKIDDIVWMPVNHKIKAKIDFMGVNMDVQYLATMKDIEVETDSIIDRKIIENLDKRTSPANDSTAIPSLKASKKGEKKSKRQKKIEKLLQKDELSNRETFKLLRMVKREQREMEKDTTPDYHISNKHMVKSADSVFADNDSLWESDRSIPLSPKEKNIYTRNDSLDFSIMTRGDTGRKKQSTFNKILFYNQKVWGQKPHTSWQLRGLFSGIVPNFNTVDGWKLKKKLIDFNWGNFKNRFLNIAPSITYAFARDRWMGELQLNSQYNRKLQAGIYASLGRRSSDYNDPPNLPPWINTISSLIFSSNYKKFYEEDFAILGHRIEPLNGLEIDLSAEISKRKVLRNHSNQMWFDFMGEAYTENLPKHPEQHFRKNIYDNDNFNLKASIRYTPKLFYKYLQYKKVRVNSKYPTFGLDYEQGFPNIFESDGNYQLLSLSIEQATSYRLIDEVKYRFEAGKFLKREKLHFADFKSFKTEPFYFMSTADAMGFKVMDYYAYNSRKAYFEGHLSIMDNHILLKYLPLLNRTNWKEKLHFNYLYTSDQKEHYSEIGYSLNRLFMFLNAGIYLGFENEKYQHIGFRLGLDVEQFTD